MLVAFMLLGPLACERQHVRSSQLIIHVLLSLIVRHNLNAFGAAI